MPIAANPIDGSCGGIHMKASLDRMSLDFGRRLLIAIPDYIPRMKAAYESHPDVQRQTDFVKSCIGVENISFLDEYRK
jgi:hypothetical protein